MALSKVHLGDFLRVYRVNCGISNLTCLDVSGVNKDKEFFEPAKQVGVDTSNYKIVPPDYFACNLMHIGRDVVLPIALNRTSKSKYVSPAYTVFCLINEKVILKDLTNGAIIPIEPLPPVMIKMLNDGGLVEHIKKNGDFKLT